MQAAARRALGGAAARAGLAEARSFAASSSQLIQHSSQIIGAAFAGLPGHAGCGGFLLRPGFISRGFAAQAEPLKVRAE